MTIPLNIFLMIVIPELIIFTIWIKFCVWSTQSQPKPKKKKKVIILRTTNYPFDGGEEIPVEAS